MLFFTYPKDVLPDLSQHILLALDAPPLTSADADYGLFVIDATWVYAQKIFRQLETPHRFLMRSLPSTYQTAYPRRQEDCSNPARGLASVEALYLAYRILGRDCSGLLDNYHWQEPFLKKNNLSFGLIL